MVTFKILLPMQVCRIFVEFVFKFICKIYIYNRYIYSYISVLYKTKCLKNKDDSDLL